MTTSPSRDDVMAFVRDRVARRTGAPAADIVPATVLLDIGLQSIDAVLICGEMEDRFEIELDPSMMFEFSTLDELTSAVLKVIESA